MIGTQGQGLTFDPNSDINMECCVDADFITLETLGQKISYVCEVKE